MGILTKGNMNDDIVTSWHPVWLAVQYCDLLCQSRLGVSPCKAHKEVSLLQPVLTSGNALVDKPAIVHGVVLLFMGTTNMGICVVTQIAFAVRGHLWVLFTCRLCESLVPVAQKYDMWDQFEGCMGASMETFMKTVP